MGVKLDTLRLFRVFDQVTDPILFLDRNHRVQYMNAAAARLYEVNPAESCGTPPSRFFTPVSPHITCEEIISVARMTGTWQGDMAHVLQNGTKIHTACSVNAIFEAENNLSGFLVISHDISRFRCQVEKPDRNSDPYFLLDEFHKMEAVGKLAGVIAHDFNNHLAGILGNLSVAVRKLDSTHPVHHLLTSAKGAAERSAHLVKQLLSFSQHHTTDFHKLNLNATLVGLRNMITPESDSNLTLNLDLSPDLPLILADAAQVAQAVINLVVNAREELCNGGTIHIRTHTVQHSQLMKAMTPIQYVSLQIEDNGSGMDAETKAHIFEPFFSTKTDKQVIGAGLGLSIVWGIIHRHKGFIEVDTQIGRGTRVCLFFPACAPCDTALPVTTKAPSVDSEYPQH